MSMCLAAFRAGGLNTSGIPARRRLSRYRGPCHGKLSHR